MLGKPVTFKDFAKGAYAEASRTGALNAAGNAAQRAVVQGGLPEGARQAKDGNHYVPDPQRPGKYLQVVPNGG